MFAVICSIFYLEKCKREKFLYWKNKRGKIDVLLHVPRLFFLGYTGSLSTAPLPSSEHQRLLALCLWQTVLDVGETLSIIEYASIHRKRKIMTMCTTMICISVEKRKRIFPTQLIIRLYLLLLLLMYYSTLYIGSKGAPSSSFAYLYICKLDSHFFPEFYLYASSFTFSTHILCFKPFHLHKTHYSLF